MISITPIAAPAVSLVVGYVLFYEGVLFHIGNESPFWSWLRSKLPYVDDEAREAGFYTTYPVGEDQLVGVLDMGRSETLSALEAAGFLRQPLAAHKEDWQGRREAGSFGYFGRHGSEIRAMPRWRRFLFMAFIARRQDPHLTIFLRDDGRVVVTAHSEWSPYFVGKAVEHFRSKGTDVERGEERARELLSGEGVRWHELVQ